jgi:hypothetical protein
MAARTCLLMSVLAFSTVYLSALFRGQSVTSVWLWALVAMVVFAIIGFFLGWAFESLIKEAMIREEAMIFENHLEKNSEARGSEAIDEENGEDEDEDEDHGESI